MWNRYSVRRRSRRSRPEYRFERAITFDATVGSPSNFYRIFRKLFSFKYMWNRYLLRRRSRRVRLEYRFERAIPVDPTVGSPSNFYRSFRKPFSLW
jgi:hypothetical protein